MSENSSTPWFEQWFDSTYYHILYSNRDEKEAERFIRRLCGSPFFPPTGKVLDLGCGKGRHAQTFHDLGYTTSGIDLSPNSIEWARRKRSPEINFEVGDMRDFQTASPQDVIANLFTSFGYFDNVAENLKVLECIRKNIRDEGIFILDFFNLHHVSANLVKREEKVVKDVLFHIRREISETHVLKNIQLDHDGEHIDVTERVQALKPEELHVLVREVGFEIEATFGSYHLEPFDMMFSPRIIIVAKKV